MEAKGSAGNGLGLGWQSRVDLTPTSPGWRREEAKQRQWDVAAGTCQEEAASNCNCMVRWMNSFGQQPSGMHSLARPNGLSHHRDRQEQEAQVMAFSGAESVMESWLCCKLRWQGGQQASTVSLAKARMPLDRMEAQTMTWSQVSLW